FEKPLETRARNRSGISVVEQNVPVRARLDLNQPSGGGIKQGETQPIVGNDGLQVYMKPFEHVIQRLSQMDLREYGVHRILLGLWGPLPHLRRIRIRAHLHAAVDAAEVVGAHGRGENRAAGSD